MKRLKLTILIVDDWPDAAEALGSLLACYGHDFHVAHNGKEAIEKARRIKPDVVLLDIAMPKMSGLEVARNLAAPGDQRPLLIALSGFCTNDDKAKAYTAGFDHFFAKPVDPNALVMILEERKNYLLLGNPDEVASDLQPAVSCG